jgi:protein tyrosine phosphatase
MPNTTNAFWQMVWEQGSSVIVALTRPSTNNLFVFFFCLKISLYFS